MKIIIIGAGELGQLVAVKLCAIRHKVVLIDIEESGLERVHSTLDALAMKGHGTSIETLKNAGAANADVLLALSGDEAVNVLSCRIASQLGTRQTICRIFSDNVFSEADGLTPAFFGIDHVFSSTAECVDVIDSVLKNQILLENIRFPHPDARISVLRVPLNSAITGRKLKNLPCAELLKNIRIAAAVRDKSLIVPNGDTQLQPGDRLYIAGKVQDVEEFVHWLSLKGSDPISRVVIAGVSRISEKLLVRLLKRNYNLLLIERDYKRAEQLLNSLPPGVMVISGDATEMEILQEAGVAGCDAFAALGDYDESNILSCLLASKLGAKKVIALTGKAEYVDILPSLEKIGCRFNSTQIAANTVFRMLAGETVHVLPELDNVDASLAEFRLTSASPFAGKILRECSFPENLLIALLMRGDTVYSPNGNFILQPGDILFSIATPETIRKMQKML